MRALVAVSGGPDSMALMDYLERQDVDYVVCHVNYRHRPTADRDENIVRQWCKEHNREIRALYPVYTKGNFEGWARDVRYQFFKDTAKELGIDTLYVGHHQDDLLETWMMQKERGNIVEHYGLQKESVQDGLTIIRPFLNRTKIALLNLCDVQGIAYGIDETNLSDDYTRNRIRHNVIEPATTQQRLQWLVQIDEDNKRLAKRRKHARQVIERNSAGAILTDSDNWFILEMFFFQKLGIHYGRRTMQDLCRKLLNGNKVIVHDTYAQVQNDTIVFSQEDWQEVVLKNWDELVQYSVSNQKDKPFQVQKMGKEIESFYVSDSDFPICIRQATADDVVCMRYGRKKVLRVLRDRKIPFVARSTYPVVVNQEGVVMFVSSSGCSKENYQSGEKWFVVRK